MNKKIGVFIKISFLLYVLAVMFFCFFTISLPEKVDLAQYFLGIRGDRIAHFIMFLPYPFIAWLTCNYSHHLLRFRRYSIYITLLTGVLFALATELTQYLFITSREGDILDFTADCVAILSGTLIIYLFSRIHLHY